ncbi:hypothetical protein CLV40_13712 [Actinokineospora auranticolor]|uniref:DUF3093 family protein n=1 Tax=Actinokineospora auranticolor TaxID=155976 RepID=A0A2S6GC30_9PSEU|nr:hypothetical protein CLV40_13712 [Actinokineospora auranticolor]
MLGVNGLELVIVHIALSWEPGRVALFVLGVVGVVWVLGVIATLHKCPHVISDRELRLRPVFAASVRVPVGDIESVRAITRSRSLKRVAEIIDGDTLVFEESSSSNVTVDLRVPLEVDLGRGGAGAVRRIDFWVDEPAVAVSAIRDRIRQGD